MNKSKLSISLPYELLLFIDHKQQQSAYASRSSVIQEALELLQERELCVAYKAANSETSDDEWDISLLDGLDEER